MKYLVLIIALIFSLNSTGFAGIVMDQERYESDSSYRQLGKIYMQNNKFKFYDLNQKVATIFDLRKGELYYISYVNKTYTVTTPESLIKYFKKTSDEIKKQIEEDLKNMPPEQRVEVEKILKEKGYTDTEQEKVSLSIEKTGKVLDISGYDCSIFKIYKNKNLNEEICLSNSVDYQNEVDIKKLSSFISEFKKLGKSLGNDIVVEDENKYLELFENNGYPLRTVDYSVKGSVFIEEISSIKKSKIKKEEFYPPEDFENKTLEEMMASLGSN